MQTKTIKLTVLFKSGVEKTYLHYNVTDRGIEETKLNLRRVIDTGENDALIFSNTFIAISEIASVEIEVLE